MDNSTIDSKTIQNLENGLYITNDVYTTKVTRDDIDKAVRDEYGALYSQDGTRILRAPKDVENYEIKAGTKIIVDNAFLSSKINNITIPHTITHIGDDAFGWTPLHSITLPESLIHINGNPFTGCKELKIICLSTHFIVERDALYSFDKTKLISYFGNESSLSLPQEVVTIGDKACSYCTSLQSVSLPSSITDIGDMAFWRCSSLRNVNLNQGLTHIGNNAFGDCLLESFILPKSLKHIDGNPISGCIITQEVISLSPHFIVDGDAIYSHDKTRLICYFGHRPSVTLPSGLTQIGYNSFFKSHLHSITIPESLTHIEGNPFAGSNISEVTCLSPHFIVEDKAIYSQDGTRLISYFGKNLNFSIKEGVTHIGESAFCENRIVGAIFLPSSLKHVDNLAFWLCTNLQYIYLPKDIIDIGNKAFRGCPILKFMIPSDTTDRYSKLLEVVVSQEITIKEYVISPDLQSSSEVELTTQVTQDDIDNGVTDINGVIYSQDGKRLLRSPRCIEFTQYKIIEGTEIIADKAFGDYHWITSNRLTSVTIPPSVTSIGKNAFSSCSSTLQSVSFNEGLEYIGDWAFSYCSKLHSILLPKSLKQIDGNPFAGCEELEVTSLSPHFIVEGKAIYSQDGTKLISYFGDEPIKEGVTYIGDSAFWSNRSIGSISLPSSVTHIGNGAFGNCTNLQSVSLSKGLKYIGDSAFSDCVSLNYISNFYNVTHIGKNAFRSCRSIKSFTLSDSLIYIGEKAFSAYPGAKIFIPPGTKERFTRLLNDEYSSRNLIEKETITDITGYCYPIYQSNILCVNKIDLENGVEDEIGAIYSSDYKRLLKVPESTSSYHIKNGTEIIADMAFNSCAKLKDIVIPDSVTNIGHSFAGCTSLQSICLPSGLTFISWATFKDCISLQSISLPKELTHIDNSVFKNCYSLTSVDLPEGLIGIANEAFSDCRSLEYISLPHGVSIIGQKTFWNCESLQSINLPSSLTHIGSSAFQNCKSLKFISLPPGVTHIYDFVFSGCDTLECVSLSSSMIYIGKEAFNECLCLQFVSLPPYLTHLGEKAFRGCKSLRSISLPKSLVYIGEDVFERCDNLSEIIIPHGTKERFTTLLNGTELIDKLFEEKSSSISEEAPC